MTILPQVEAGRKLGKEIFPNEQDEQQGQLEWLQVLPVLMATSLKPEIWFKRGNDTFYVADWDPETGKTTLYETKGSGKDRIRGKCLGSAWPALWKLSVEGEGGILWIPTMPQGLPLKENVLLSNTIGVECDTGSFEEQSAAYAEFERVTGIHLLLMLSSGGKSIHGHVGLDRNHVIEDNVYLSRLVCLAFLADPAVCNPHQPMRFPGFWRKEKGRRQELIAVNPEARYTREKVLEGLLLWFEFLGLKMPDRIPDAWWPSLTATFKTPKGSDPLPREERLQRLREVLADGLDVFESQRIRRIEHQSKQSKLNGSGSLVGQLEDILAKLGPDAFDWTGHNFQGNGDHYRGGCPFHDSQTGTAGWLKNTAKGWRYHCPTCTNNHPMDGFEYWIKLRGSGNPETLKGREWVNQLKLFAAYHGERIDDLKPDPPSSAVEVDIDEWYRQRDIAPTRRIPAARVAQADTAPCGSCFQDILAEETRELLAWDITGQRWLKYGGSVPGIWEEISIELVKAMIKSKLRAHYRRQRELDPEGDYPEIPSFGKINETYNHLMIDLAVPGWDGNKDLIPLIDGVLDPVSLKLSAHAPGYRFTWCLPYRWTERGNGCDNIRAWMLETVQGDPQLVELLRAFLNAVVKGRVDLQRYLELIGPGGTGKSTLIRLATTLVGQGNTFTTTLQQLETNRFETAGIRDKRLVIISDSERYSGSVNTLKALTGQDELRHEVKGIQQRHGFRPTAMVMVAANEPIQSNDYTSGLERRRLTIPFLNQVPEGKRRDLEAEFRPGLPALLEWVLTMPDDEVSRLVRDTRRALPQLQSYKFEALCDSNPLAAWIRDRIRHVPGHRTQIGVANRIRMTDGSKSWDTFENVTTWLYANYAQFCQEQGTQRMALRRFSSLVEDVCRRQLGWDDVKRLKDRTGAFIVGLEINSDNHDDWRRILNPATVTVNVMDCDGYVMAETRAGDECDGCDGFFRVEKNILQTHSDPPVAESAVCADIGVAKWNENLPSHPSHSSPVSLPAITHPSHTGGFTVTPGQRIRLKRDGSEWIVLRVEDQPAKKGSMTTWVTSRNAAGFEDLRQLHEVELISEPDPITVPPSGTVAELDPCPFQVGDWVLCSCHGVDEEQRRMIRKYKEAPIDQKVRILSIEADVNPWTHIPNWMIRVETEKGKVYVLGTKDLEAL